MNRSKLSKAMAIVSIIENEATDNQNNSMFLGAYQNGREQGFSITTYVDCKTRYVCFSENRNSDSIVVYSSDFDPMQSITETMYEERRTFSSYEKCAEYVLRLLFN
jgi:hypothetical protein